MTTTALSDAELLAQARQGDEAAFTELYVRHHAAARRLATAYPRAGDPDDLVNGAFERILGAVKRGGGPDEAFRAYLFVTLRRMAADLIGKAHDEPVDEVPEPVRAEEQTPELDAADRQLVVSAYESLQERWQAVLWQTAVEGRQPRELAGMLGMSANAAAALAYRAREKLRQAYLQAHLQATPRPQCEPHRSRLGAYVREGLSRRDQGATDSHLDGCGSCRSLVAELVDVNRMLVRSLFPVFTAAASQTGVAAVAGGAAAGGGALFMGKQLVGKARSNPTVVAGVVAVAALALALIANRGGEQTALPNPPPDEVEETTPAPRPAPAPDDPAEPPAPPPDQPSLVQPVTTPPESTTTTSPPEQPVPPSSTTTTMTIPPAPPPPPPTGPVVWVPGSSELRITLTNTASVRSEPILIAVDLDGGAVVTGAPEGCGLGLALFWTAKCAVMPLDPGETHVVSVPARVTGPDQLAETWICETELLALDCALDPPEKHTTPMPPADGEDP